MASKHRYQELYTDNPILISSENFAHDADTLLLQAEIAKKAASVLRINQKKIVKKQQQTTSKNLHKCVEKYNGCLVEIRDAVNRIQDTLSDDGLDEMKLSRKNEVLRPHNAAKRKRDIPQTVCDDLGPEIECMSCIGKEIDIKKTSRRIRKAAYTECSKLASENFFERAQRCIEIPAEGFQLPLDYKEVMPDQLKRQVKEFRKARAPHVVKEVEMILMTRIKSENQDLEAVSVYLSHCIEIAWICAVQDPPIIFRRDAPVEFDTNAFKEYTRRGKYTEFVVWPALYLHDGGVLLLKGVAQGTDTKTPEVKYQLRLDGYHQQGTSKTTNNAFSANSLNVRF